MSKRISKKQFDKVLRLHKLWLNKKKGGVRANLQEMDLQHLDFNNVDLRKANLRGINLSGIYLHYVDFRGANLINANLSYSCFEHSKLNCADLRGTNLHDAFIGNTCLDDVKTNHLTIGYHMICPEKGSFTCFKKLCNNLIAELQVFKNTRRSSATSRKCRAEYVKVISIVDSNGKHFNKGHTFHCLEKTVYEVGKIVACDYWDEDRWRECSGGIHFFMTREEAINWQR